LSCFCFVVVLFAAEASARITVSPGEEHIAIKAMQGEITVVESQVESEISPSLVFLRRMEEQLRKKKEELSKKEDELREAKKELREEKQELREEKQQLQKKEEEQKQELREEKQELREEKQQLQKKEEELKMKELRMLDSGEFLPSPTGM
jgi:hypothetical protein